MKPAVDRQSPEGIAHDDWRQTPPSVRAAFEQQVETIEQARSEIGALRQRIAELEAEKDLLLEQARTTSRNSSKPPSTDPRSAPARGRRAPTGRTRGGQPGHPGASRQLYAAEQCQRVVDHKPAECGACGEALSGDDPEPYRHQIVEIPPVQVQIEEHRLHALECGACGALTRATLPPEVEPSGYGPRFVAIVALLSTLLRSSVRKTQDVMQGLFGVRLATGTIALLRVEMSEAVRPAVEDAARYVRQEALVKHADETSYAQGNADGANPTRRRGWVWVVVTPLVTVFRICLSRDKEAAKAVLGEAFRGVLVTDRYGAYGWVRLGLRQICWAHLAREFVKMSERGGESGPLGEELLELTGTLFKLWDRVRDGTLERSSFRQYLGPIRRRIYEVLERGASYRAGKGERSGRSRTAGTCREVLKMERAMYLFARLPGVEPTNNGAERALRHVVLWRRMSFGSQSEAGSQFVARMMTVMATLSAQERDLLEYFMSACQARRDGVECPSLLPSEEATARHRIAA